MGIIKWNLLSRWPIGNKARQLAGGAKVVVVPNEDAKSAAAAAAAKELWDALSKHCTTDGEGRILRPPWAAVACLAAATVLAAIAAGWVVSRTVGGGAYCQQPRQPKGTYRSAKESDDELSEDGTASTLTSSFSSCSPLERKTTPPSSLNFRSETVEI